LDEEATKPVGQNYSLREIQPFMEEYNHGKEDGMADSGSLPSTSASPAGTPQSAAGTRNAAQAQPNVPVVPPDLALMPVIGGESGQNLPNHVFL